MKEKSQILWRIPLAVAAAFSISLAVGCDLGLSPAVGPHPAAWRQTHGHTVRTAGGVDKATISTGAKCADCHTTVRQANGTVAASPIAKTTCFTCHNGPTGGGE